MPTVELGLFVFGGDVDLEPNALLFDFGPLWSFLEMYVGIEAHKSGPFSVSHTKKKLVPFHLISMNLSVALELFRLHLGSDRAA